MATLESFVDFRFKPVTSLGTFAVAAKIMDFRIVGGVARHSDSSCWNT